MRLQPTKAVFELRNSIQHIRILRYLLRYSEEHFEIELFLVTLQAFIFYSVRVSSIARVHCQY